MDTSEVIANVLEEPGSSAEFLSDPELFGLVTFLCLFGSIGFIENIVVILSTSLGHGYLDVPSNIFLLSLASADILVCAVSVPLLICNCFHWIFTIFITVSKFIVVATVGSIFLLTLNRLLSIVRPMRYHHLVTVRRSVLIVAVIWVIACLVVVGAIIGSQIGTIWLAKITRYFLSFYILTTSLMYVYMYALSRQQMKLMKIHAVAITGQVRGACREFHSVKTLAMVVGTLFACWLPMTMALFFTNREKRPQLFYRTFTYTAPLIVINAVVDPIIYYYRSRGFRVSLKTLKKRIKEYFY